MSKIATTAYILGLAALLTGGMVGCKKEDVEPDTNVYVYNYGSVDSSRYTSNGGTAVAHPSGAGGTTVNNSNWGGGSNSGTSGGGTTGGQVSGGTTGGQVSGGTTAGNGETCDDKEHKDKNKHKHHHHKK